MNTLLDINSVNLFVELLQSRCGILIKNHQYTELKKAIIDVSSCFGLTPESLLKKISTCEENDPVFEHLIANVTVGESYFFRDADQFEWLEHDVLPNLINKKSQHLFSTLRIWSAGCSSGEEIYSIAMLLNEKKFDRKKVKVQLIGSDINCELLKKAKSGDYSDWSFRTTSDYFREKYFTKKGNRYHIQKDIKDAVQFNYLNLNNLNYPSIVSGIFALDIILCRNVFIYFDLDRIKSIMKQFSASLSSEGLVILGASDPIVFSTEDLAHCHTNKTSFFKNIATMSTDLLNLSDKIKNINIQKNLQPEIKLEKETILLANDDFEVRINNFMSRSDWRSAIDYINQIYNTSHQLSYSVELIMIKCLANLGFIQLAESRCHQLLKTHSLSSELYYLLGLCQSELNQLKAAESSFRKSLYLDHHYIIAQIQLGHLLLRQYKQSEGVRLLKVAINTLNNFSEDHIVKDYPCMNAGNLKKLLQNELSLYLTDKGIGNEI